MRTANKDDQNEDYKLQVQLEDNGGRSTRQGLKYRTGKPLFTVYKTVANGNSKSFESFTENGERWRSDVVASLVYVQLGVTRYKSS